MNHPGEFVLPGMIPQGCAQGIPDAGSAHLPHYKTGPADYRIIAVWSGKALMART
jgi:hypothetical protein